MVCRFLVLPRHRTQAHDASLQVTFETPELTVLTDRDTPCLVVRECQGLIIGHLFTRENKPRPVTQLQAREADAIVASDGQILIDRYWGGYCYVRCDHRGALMSILRDPSGGMPCYWVETGGDFLAASDARLLAQSLPASLSIDWEAMRRHLYAYDLRNGATCLHGVTELMPGERVTFGPSVLTVSCWSPWKHTAPARRWTETDLRQTVDACVQAWSSVSGPILQTVSGGLDSSICTAALRDSPTAVTCLTMVTDEAEGDERPYARVLAKAFGRVLIEAEHALADVDITQTLSGHLPRPVNYALGQSELPARRAVMERHECDTLFTGVGGDNVFCHMRSATAVADRLLTCDVGGALSTLIDVCRMTDASLSEVAGAAWRKYRDADPAYRWQTNESYLKDLPRSLRVDHSWLKAPHRALPGQSVHIAMLLRLQATTDGYDRAIWPLQINPLTSQPIMELCLGIPSWRWCEGGRDRSVARAAFADILPKALIDRRSKGGANSFAHQIVTKNRDRLREHLCEGLLAKHEVLNRSAIAQVLDPQSDIPFTEHLRLLFLAEAESWARMWSAGPPPAFSTPRVTRGHANPGSVKV